MDRLNAGKPLRVGKYQSGDKSPHSKLSLPTPNKSLRIADVTNTPHGALTSTNAVNKLRELRIADGTVTRVRDVMQSCDEAKYGATGGSTSDLPAKAASVLDDLVRAMKVQRLLS